MAILDPQAVSSHGGLQRALLSSNRWKGGIGNVLLAVQDAHYNEFIVADHLIEDKIFSLSDASIA